MEPFEKMEIILEGMIKEMEKDVDRARNSGIHPSQPYIQGMEHELIGLKRASFIIRAIKEDDFTASDEYIEKNWKTTLKPL